MFKTDENLLFQALYEPSADEFAGMAATLSDKYTQQELSALADCSMGFWSAFRSGRRDAGRLIKRVIWFLYMLETNPEALLKGKHVIFFWGKTHGRLPKYSQMKSGERLHVVRELVQRARDMKWNYSVQEIASVCGAPESMVQAVCSEYGYTPTAHDIVDLYVPGSIWYRMDWRKSDKKLAALHRMPISVISVARAKLAAMPAAIAATNIYRTQGADFDYFWCLWRDTKQIEVYNEAVKISAKRLQNVDTTVFSNAAGDSATQPGAKELNAPTEKSRKT